MTDKPRQPLRFRLKHNGQEYVGLSSFNPGSLFEVLTGDDSVPISQLDVLIGSEWMDMRQAFVDNRLIPDNYNIHFREPHTREELDRGYFLAARRIHDSHRTSPPWYRRQTHGQVADQEDAGRRTAIVQTDSNFDIYQEMDMGHQRH